MMLIGLFGLLSLWFGNGVAIHATICSPTMTPVIVTPMTSTPITGGQPTLVSGDAQAGDTVTVIDNGTSYATVTADDSDNFAVGVTLTAGNHTLGVTSTDACNNLTTGASVTVSVTAPPSPPASQVTSTSSETAASAQANSNSSPSTTSPAALPPALGTGAPSSKTALGLTITKPSSQATTTDTSVYLQGTTTESATETVSVNGMEIAQSQIAEKTFGFLVPLRIGTNTVTVTAATGSEKVTRSLTLTRVAQRTWYVTPAGKVLIGGTSLAAVLVIVLIIMVII